MKTRDGFVSNSSSSSFVVSLKQVTADQVEKIMNYPATSRDLGLKYLHNDVWQMEVVRKACAGRDSGGFVRGETTAADFEMKELLKQIGVLDSEVQWSYF